jgi:glyoxylase-like metal-dependent hydrolase (beta-lactamase superfamily II)
MLTLNHLVTSGTFSLDGGTWDVDNNVWVLGDDAECVVIDAPHDAGAIAAAVAPRRLTAILCTHAHDDHIDAAAALAEATGAPIWLHPADRELWDQTYPGRAPDRDLADGQVITVAGAGLTVLHTPGHSRGAVCFHLPDQGWLFSGDTLFAGGPGATGRSFSDFGTIIDSIRDRLLVLDPDTVVHTGRIPPSAPNDLTCRNGSPAATDPQAAWSAARRAGLPRGRA